MNYESLLVKDEAGILTVTVNRPEAMNALNKNVLSGLHGILSWLESEAGNGIKAMILTGAGEKAFVAGADIKEFESLSTSAAREVALGGQTLFARLEKLKIPVLAAVNGFALGGGLELALACDFIYASENAKFGLPECTLGLMPGYGGTVRLPRRIGAGKAREMTYTGSMISAQEALACGLVNRVLPANEVLTAAQETAKTISQRAPVAVAKIKQSILEGMNMTEGQALELEAGLFGELFATEDKKEGVQAFIEKRKAKFTGK